MDDASTREIYEAERPQDVIKNYWSRGSSNRMQKSRLSGLNSKASTALLKCGTKLSLR